MEPNERLILERFFTNADRPIFALQNMPPAVQNYIYTGVSRFPDVRERFLKLLKEKGVFEKTAVAIKVGTEKEAMGPLIEHTSKRNSAMYFEMRHGSSAEGANVFVVSENCPIYATEDLQDFYWPMTTMEFSTRYAKRFDIGRVYWDPTLMKSEFAGELKEAMARNFGLYEKGYEPVLEVVKEKLKGAELKTTISALDSLRMCIPLAAHTTVILGGNTRAVLEHFRKLLASKDNFIREYTNTALQELSKVFPSFYENLQPDPHIIERNRRLREYAEGLFGKKFEHVREDVRLFYNVPPEEQALAQILYPYVTVPFENVLGKVSGFTDGERKELFNLATLGRENRRNPIRGLETRHLIYEIESGWGLWKDFKRNRMNLRFHQDMRGLAGWITPDMISESSIAKEYEEAQKAASNLMEKVYDKYGHLSRAVATQGSRKRYLLCMGPRQLTVLGELRTCGEGDRGYRKIASRMIELAKEQSPRLFGHVIDNYKNR
ncbi:MAG: FAD-dependent thymidylate synthase [Candidatus Aenigmatarchaeota archaeon]